MRLKSYNFRGLRVLAGLVGLFVVSSVSQAGYFLTHHLDDIESGGSTTNLMLFHRDTTSWLTWFFSSGEGDNTINDPFERSSAPVVTSVIGQSGGSLALGLNAAATADALDIGFDFFTYFGYDDQDLYDAITDISNSVNVTASFDLLFNFFDDNETHLVTVGDMGSLVSFTNGNERGDYYVTYDQDPSDVPEPFTMALGAAGAGLAAFRQRRRKLAK